ncbi:MAG TPA: hypothetical protein DEP57_00290 [Selenomonas sp.]|nr:hypothetical protein [Selenomonas sp.]
MPKRLLSTDKRAEAILDHMKKNNANISGYICSAVIDEYLPVYSTLRIEALYLLDYVIDGAKDWKGNKLIVGSDEDEKNYIIRQTLGRSISWLKENHKIKKCNVIRDIVLCFFESELCGGVQLKNLNDNVKKNIDDVKIKLKEIDGDYSESYIGLGNLSLEILDRWDKLWECDTAYDVLISVVYCENMKYKIDPLDAIKMVQNIENEFIIEAIGEK